MTTPPQPGTVGKGWQYYTCRDMNYGQTESIVGEILLSSDIDSIENCQQMAEAKNLPFFAVSGCKCWGGTDYYTPQESTPLPCVQACRGTSKTCFANLFSSQTPGCGWDASNLPSPSNRQQASVFVNVPMVDAVCQTPVSKMVPLQCAPFSSCNPSASGEIFPHQQCYYNELRMYGPSQQILPNVPKTSVIGLNQQSLCVGAGTCSTCGKLTVSAPFDVCSDDTSCYQGPRVVGGKQCCSTNIIGYDVDSCSAVPPPESQTGKCLPCAAGYTSRMISCSEYSNSTDGARKTMAMFQCVPATYSCVGGKCIVQSDGKGTYTDAGCDGHC